MAVVNKAIEFNPSQRFQTPAEMLEELKAPCRR